MSSSWALAVLCLPPLPASTVARLGLGLRLRPSGRLGAGVLIMSAFRLSGVALPCVPGFGSRWNPCSCGRITGRSVSRRASGGGRLRSLTVRHVGARAARLPTPLPRRHLHSFTDLVRQRAQLRHYLRSEHAELRRRRLLIGFAAFVASGRPLTNHAVQTAQAWIRQLDISIASAVALLNTLVPDLRRALRLDRAAYLHGLVQEASLQDLRDPRRLFAAVRKAFPQARSARRSSFIPLPAVLLADGTFAQTPADRQERWQAHFSAQEAGRVVTSQEYIEGFARPNIPVLPNGAVFDMDSLPTLGEVERQVVALNHGKAAGADGLTAEVYRLSPVHASAVMLPLFLKACLQVREPVEWRGGCLVALAKKAAAALRCENFRSILMASTMGKLYHRVLRGKLAPSLEACKGALQAGTSRGCWG